MRTRSLHGPEDYFGIAPEYRLWICPPDLNKAIDRLKNYPLSPARRIPGAFSYCFDRAVRASAALVAVARSAPTARAEDHDPDLAALISATRRIDGLTVHRSGRRSSRRICRWRWMGERA
jgi:hypothetical protein